MALLFFLFPQPEKHPYAKASGYLQHLNQQHSAEEAQFFRVPAQLPDIVKGWPWFCTNNMGLKMHQTCHTFSVVTPLAGRLSSTAHPTLEPVPPDILEEVDLFLDCRGVH